MLREYSVVDVEGVGRCILDVESHSLSFYSLDFLLISCPESVVLIEWGYPCYDRFSNPNVYAKRDSARSLVGSWADGCGDAYRD